MCERFHEDEFWTELDDGEREDITQDFFEEFIEKPAASCDECHDSSRLSENTHSHYKIFC